MWYDSKKKVTLIRAWKNNLKLHASIRMRTLFPRRGNKSIYIGDSENETINVKWWKTSLDKLFKTETKKKKRKKLWQEKRNALGKKKKKTRDAPC